MSIQASLDIASSRDPETFQRRLIEFAHELDFPLVSAVLVVDLPGAPSRFVAVGNTPEGYQALSADPAYSQGDPVMQRLKVLAHPFTYGQQMYVMAGQGERWEAQAQFGYRNGVALAQHMAGGRHFLLGVDRDDPLPTDERTLWRLLSDLQTFAAFAQETAVRLLTPVAGEPEKVPKLSQRELEVLRWSMDGKSVRDVADILNISERTVNFHLGNLFRKMGVSRKDVALAKAVRLGLLR